MENLLTFAQRGNLAGVIQCLRSGVSVETGDDFGRTALHEAAASGDVALIETLISYGANPNAACLDGWTPLCEAAKYNHPEAFQRLLDSGSQPDRPKPWSVYDAALRANAGISIFLALLPKLKPDMLDKRGHPLIQAALRMERMDVVSELVRLGASPPRSSADALHLPPTQQIACQVEVLVDVEGNQEPVVASLIVGWKLERLFERGPIGPSHEFVELRQRDHVLLRCETPRPGVQYPYYSLILSAREQFWHAGYYPRLAAFHPELKISGLSEESGGWIHRRPFRYLDTIRTLPDHQQNDSVDRMPRSS